ncbi:response regulator transcription factor [Desulfosporosinus meridiei]|uniref:Stage 0 sporulation protein A homolog n=1 Tax=Desulfosporosinus meridiei (strain ATCC BAA-275 / DSM 13257 / KCTC 12902 / NCIMB 13706 / S10) TaxID=768704 RepID=J7IQX4_DESMD|nr:response regulator [Desulfosporosinus meridiei]AFQ44252.1 response regulator containing CheY-like receiver domain and AraC-type DNA-binding domain [Desulfosporosinus meridiei DSM 13257]
MYKVLLVDDEELERKILWLTLQNSDLPIATIHEAVNGRDALEKVHLLQPDLVIMDIKMPGIDGIEATKQIKSFYPSTEVIILTAYGKFSYSQKAIKAQATDYLLKPILPQLLIEAVRQALNRLSRQKFQPGPAMDFTNLEELVKVGDLGEGKRQLALIFAKLAEVEPLPSTALLYSFGLRLMVIVLQAALSAGADPGEVTSTEYDLVQNLSHITSHSTLEAWGAGMLEKCIRLLGSAIQQHNQGLTLIRKAMEYIDHNYAENISLNMVAKHVHLSPAYLSRIFNKNTGVGFTDYLTQVRLKKAKHQLRRSADTIDQIAIATGFNSSSYFSAIFKKSEGLTPSEYRGKHFGVS